MPENRRSAKRYQPEVPFFRNLFTPVRSVRALFRVPGYDSYGFPEGSSVLIAGHPGAGKAFFTLALVRALMRAPGNREHRLYYVSVGEGEEQIRRSYREYGWFGDDEEPDPIFSDRRVRFVDVDEGGMPRPTRGAEELINPAMGRLGRLEAARAEGPAFVVVDSLTALIKDSRSAGERRRNINDVLRRLGATVPGLALSFLIVETEEAPEAGAGPEEEHVADFVLRLSLRDIGFGRRAREVEVVKYRDDTPMLLGAHSWEKLWSSNLKAVVASELLDAHIRDRLFEPGPGWIPEGHRARWATVLVSPYPRLPAIGGLQQWPPNWSSTATSERMFSGTPGLDEMLRGDFDYWARPVEAILGEGPERAGRAPGGLYQGSTTLILGRAGTGKTICCLQFLLAQRDASGPRPRECLYINFENKPERILEWFPGDADDRATLQRCHVLYRRRSHLDLNLLVAEISYIVRSQPIRRVAIDGLSDLLSVLAPREYSRLVEDLIVTMRQAYLDRALEDGSPWADERLTIFIGMETDDSAEAVARLGFDSFADNVLLLQSLTLNDERRKVVQVLKARGNSPDRLTREVVVVKGDRFPLRFVPGLENYRNLAGAAPELVRVTLQLVAENAVEKAFNGRLLAQLHLLFGYEVKRFGFARDEIIRTLLDLASGVGRVPHADINVFNIDEWWIRELRVAGLRAPGRYLAERRHPLLPLNSFLSQGPGPRGPAGSDVDYLSSDFWVFEMEKASVPRLVRAEGSAPGGAPLWGEVRADVVALPSYLDFGLFCINTRLARGLAGWGPEEAIADGWPAWVDAVPRAWARPDGQWFAPPDPKASPLAIVDLMRRSVLAAPGSTGFGFDLGTATTASCAFLELSWGFGAAEDFFVTDAAAFRDAAAPGAAESFARSHPATVGMRFLGYLVLEGLMEPRPSLNDSARALFSRQWLSTLMDRDEPGDATAPARAEYLRPVPFFPIGAEPDRPPAAPGGPSPAFRRAVADAHRRFERLADRLLAAVDYRRGLWPDDQEPTWQLLRGWRGWARSRCIALAVAGAGWPEVDADLAFLRTVGAQIRRAASRSPLFQVGRGVVRTRPPDDAWSARWSPEYPLAAGAGDRLWKRRPAAMFLDLRDINLLLDWHDIRVDLLTAERRGEPISGVVARARDRGPAAPPGDGTPAPPVGPPTALTGYACTGSWMLGVDRTTRSPSLAAKFLTEMTSAARAADRGDVGAGIPARKDFFDFHGGDPVPFLPDGQMDWGCFLRITGARSRRRDRVFCSRLRASDFFNAIHQRVQHLLSVAAGLKRDYESGGRERDAAIEVVADVARRSMQELFENVVDGMGRAADDEAGLLGPGAAATPCLTCPRPDLCGRVLGVAGGAAR